MNCFQLLPFDLEKMIISLVPLAYHHSTLNVVQNSWHHFIIPNQEKRIEVKDYNNFLFISSYDFKFTFEIDDHFNDVKFMNQFLSDRKDMDIVLIKPSIKDQFKKFILLSFMIFFNRKDLLVKQTIDLEDYIYVAVNHGMIDMLIFLHENGCPWKLPACHFAAFNGHLDCLKYLHENGCPWDELCCNNATENGHLEVLKYLHENGCPWNSFCCEYATQNRHVEILKYLHENGCTWDTWPFHY